MGIKWLDKRVRQFEEANGHKPVALITGASSGMGLEYARLLGGAGCPLIIVSNREEELLTAAEGLRAQARVLVCPCYMDLAAEDSAERLMEFCDNQGLAPDILINNAGTFFFEPLGSDNIRKADLIINLHIRTITRLCILFGEKMKERGYGYILNISSLASRLPFPGITMYGSSKAYLNYFGKAFHCEMKRYGVKMSTVCPPAIATPLYGLPPKLLKFGTDICVLKTPTWLVKRALRGMFKGKKLYSPGAMNVYLPVILWFMSSRFKIWAWKTVEKIIGK